MRARHCATTWWQLVHSQLVGPPLAPGSYLGNLSLEYLHVTH